VDSPQRCVFRTGCSAEQQLRPEAATGNAALDDQITDLIFEWFLKSPG
jgi:hypothetical protein